MSWTLRIPAKSWFRWRSPGICHSDEHLINGDMVPPPEMVELMAAAGVASPDWFPLLGGHEGAGSARRYPPSRRGFSSAGIPI